MVRRYCISAHFGTAWLPNHWWAGPDRLDSRTHLAFKNVFAYRHLFGVSPDVSGIFISVPKPRDVRGRCSITQPNIFCSEPRVAGCDPTSHIHNPADQAGPLFSLNMRWGDVFLFRGCFGAEREASVPQLPGACGHSEKMKTSAPL